MDFAGELNRIKKEIKSITLVLNKGHRDDIQTRLDLQLRDLAILTLESPEQHKQEINFLKDHVWALIERLNRKVL